MDIKTRVFILLFILFCTNTFSQKISHYYYWNKAFCSKHIYLDTSNIFYYTSGCEGSVSICKGTYTIKGNRFSFKTDTSIKGKLDVTIYKGNYGNNDSIYISVIDINSQPVKNFRIAFLPVQLTNGKYISEFQETDNNGFIVLKKNSFSHFVYQNCIELSSVTNDDVPWVKIETENNLYKIQFNYPDYCLKYNLIDFEEAPFNFLRFKRNKLIDKKNKLAYDLR